MLLPRHTMERNIIFGENITQQFDMIHAMSDVKSFQTNTL